MMAKAVLAKLLDTRIINCDSFPHELSDIFGQPDLYRVIFIPVCSNVAGGRSLFKLVIIYVRHNVTKVPNEMNERPHRDPIFTALDFQKPCTIILLRCGWVLADSKPGLSKATNFTSYDIYMCPAFQYQT
jgi:hypothetical protein